MIFLFILYSFFLLGNVTLAGPVVPPSYPISYYPREIDSSKFTQRSKWNIIWSCFATLFACSWVAIHPNIPPRSDSPIRRFFRRLMVMAYMLVIPEAVIYWAARQWWAARNIAKKHKNQGWTRTHGFFVLMGGFMLCDENDNVIETLSIERLEDLASRGTIRWPSISQNEIEDRSKGDIFSKGFAVIQTTWFITQCIARAAYGLTITELELATLAFAVLNGALYFLWWSKPQGVDCPAPIYLRHPSSVSKREAGTQTVDWESGENFGHDISSIHSGSTFMTKVALKSGQANLSHCENDPLLATKETNPNPLDTHTTSTFTHYFQELGHVMGFPLYALWGPVTEMATCNTITDSPPLSVPPFYAPYTDPPYDDSNVIKSKFTNSERLSAILAIIVGAVFGGIHCIAWSFNFPSFTEQFIWRLSASIITAIPVAWAVIELLKAPSELIKKYFRSRFRYDPGSLAESSNQPSSKFLQHFISGMTCLTGGPTLVAYFGSRAALLVLPLLALRSLAPDSLLDLNWSSFIPHI